MKVFGIGKGKTGSNSLALALEVLGYSVHHTGRGVWRKQPEVRDRLVENWEGKKPILEGVKEYDAYMDYPIHMAWIELLNEYPDAKFILTYRPPDDCALSWCRMVRSKREDTWSPNTISYSEYREMVAEHNDHVLKVFGTNPNLLIFDQRDNGPSKWRQLCTFLGKPIPTCKFPHAYNHEEWYMEAEEMKEGHAGMGLPRPQGIE